MTTISMENFSAKGTIGKIKDNLLDPKVLSKQARLLCVEYLVMEGLQQAAIAHFLKVSDRTVRRDVEEVRKEYGMGKNAVLTQDVLSEFLFNAKMHHSQLVKIARTATVPAAERVKAENLAWRISKDVLQELYHMGGYEEPSDSSKRQEERRKLDEKDNELKSNLSKLGAMERDVIAQQMEKYLEQTNAKVVQMLTDDQRFKESEAAKQVQAKKAAQEGHVTSLEKKTE